MYPLPALAVFTATVVVAFAQSDFAFYKSEVDYLVQLGSRITGTANQDKLIDHIQYELERLGLEVHTDHLNFTYNDSPQAPPALSVGGQSIPISSVFPYSGDTDDNGISGQLIDLTGTATPNWTAAAGNIAVVNVTNFFPPGRILPLWPSSPAWPTLTSIPAVTTVGRINLTVAAEAGVKAVIWTWEQISTGNAYGQYVPFTLPFQNVPSVYVAGDAATAVRSAAEKSETGQLTLTGTLIPDWPSRSIYSIIPGTTRANESIILNTHTDGTNSLEENGHIALLAKAKDLIAHPPQRTHILVFVTGHLRIPAFIPPGQFGQAMTRWLDDHPNLWNETGNSTSNETCSPPDEMKMKAIVGSCVEHLGGILFTENLSPNTYAPSSQDNPEWLYASTSELAALVMQYWTGVQINVTRVIDPNVSGAQAGEGGPMYDVDIPNVSLVTTTTYLLAELPVELDRVLVDIAGLGRQVNGFMRLWELYDALPSEAFGKIPPHPQGPS